VNEMPILAEYKEGKFIPLEKVRLNNGDLVELNLVTKKQFLLILSSNFSKKQSINISCSINR